MLEQACKDLGFATAITGINSWNVEKFFKTTNAIYTALSNLYGQKKNYIHREVVARELTAQLASRYPELITFLKQQLEHECKL